MIAHDSLLLLLLTLATCACCPHVGQGAPPPCHRVHHPLWCSLTLHPPS